VVKEQSNPAIAITKSPDSQTVAVGATARWTIKVTNTGNVKLHDVTVTDPKAPKCDKTFSGIFDVGESRTYTCFRPNTTEPYINTANVVGTSPTNEKVRDSDTAEVKVQPIKPRPIKPKPIKPKPPTVSHTKPKATG
jgi:hypothetical protein